MRRTSGIVHVAVITTRAKPKRTNLSFLHQKLRYMLPRLYPLFRALRPPHIPSSAAPMACVLPPAAPVSLSPSPNTISSIRLSPRVGVIGSSNHLRVSPPDSTLSGRGFHTLCREDGRDLRPLGRVRASQRDYRKVRRRASKSKEKELELNVSICIEEDMPDDLEVLVLSLSCVSFGLFCSRKFSNLKAFKFLKEGRFCCLNNGSLLSKIT